MFDRFRARIREYFYYNKTERSGLLVLIFLLFVFVLGHYIYKNTIGKNSLDDKLFLSMVDSLERKTNLQAIKLFKFNPNTANDSILESIGFSKKQRSNLINYRHAGGIFRKKLDFKKLYFVNDSIYDIYEPYLLIQNKYKKTRKRFISKTKLITQIDKPIHKDSLFNFDPNSISQSEWSKLGVSNKISRVINNYLKKGGSFKVPKDLLKIYGFEKKKYTELAPYIKIKSVGISPAEPKKKEQLIYDLNTINIDELKSIHVSKSMSKKLIKFRTKLGGYYKVNQLLELYNINEKDWEKLKKCCLVKSPVNTININTASVEDLYKHPYIDFHDAQAIVRYRNRKEKYKRLLTLQNRKILSDEVFEKVKFYLKVKD